jgi:hypothetical protein
VLLSVAVLVFLEFLTFSWWLLHKLGALLGDGILGLIIDVTKRRNLIKLIKLFLIDGILDSDDSSFSRYNHLKSFVCCVWNIEHLNNVFY